VQVNVFFFLLHLTCGKRKGRGYFFLIIIFIVGWLGKGRGLIFLYNFIMGWGAGG